MMCINESLVLTAMMRLRTGLNAARTIRYIKQQGGDGPAVVALEETRRLKYAQAKMALKVAHIRSLNCKPFAGIGKHRNDIDWLVLDQELKEASRGMRKYAHQH